MRRTTTAVALWTLSLLVCLWVGRATAPPKAAVVPPATYEQEMQQILDRYQPEIDRASAMLREGDRAGSDAVRDCVIRLRGAEIRELRRRRGMWNPPPTDPGE